MVPREGLHSLANKHSLMQKQLVLKISGNPPETTAASISSSIHGQPSSPIPFAHPSPSRLTATPDTLVSLSPLDSQVCDTLETPETLEPLRLTFV